MTFKLGKGLSSSGSKDVPLTNEAKKEELSSSANRAIAWQITEKKCSADSVIPAWMHSGCIPITDDTAQMGYSMHLKNAPTILGILLSGFSATLHSVAPDMDISVSPDLDSRQKYYNWMIVKCSV